MPDSLTRLRAALRMILLINLPSLLLLSWMAWVAHHKAASTAVARAAFQPMDLKVRDLIETERDIDKLRSIARIQNIGASGSMEALLEINKRATTTLVPGIGIALVSVMVAGGALLRSRPGKPAV